jgi:ubiquinone/menaquinone biosynthesis C-methylase UbiE
MASAKYYRQQADSLRKLAGATTDEDQMRLRRSDLPPGRSRGYDRALVFFLLHEQPSQDRERTLSEVLRVLRPGGTIVIIDYSMPRWWRPLLAGLEPFALDLWRREVADFLPAGRPVRGLRRQSFFGGLYQKIVATRVGALTALRNERQWTPAVRLGSGPNMVDKLQRNLP